MSLDCSCPDDGILADIPTSDCPFDLKQIQKLIFSTAGNVAWNILAEVAEGKPIITARLDILADVAVQLAAADNTKIVVTPFIGGDPIIEAGEAITEGGNDNSTLNGVELVTGTGPSKFTAVFKSLTPAQEEGLKLAMCKNIEIYLISQKGRIYAYQPDSAVDSITGFPTQAFWVGDRGNQGFGTNDTVAIQFSMPSGWSSKMIEVDPVDYNPLYDL